MPIRVWGLSFIFFPVFAWAGLGPELSDNLVPKGLCLITLQSNNSMRTEICSGFLLDSQHMVTAGHCTEKMTSKTKVLCDGQETLVESFSVPEGLDLENIEFDIRLRRDDVALVKLQSALDFHSERVLASTPASVMKSLSRSSRCGFFGFSHELGGSLEHTDTKVKAVEIDASYISFKDEVLQLNGTRGATALVQPGDSGGAIGCMSGDQWFFIGVVSGRDWDYQSFFAPVSSHEALYGRLDQAPQLSPNQATSPKYEASGLLIESGSEYFVKQYSRVIKTKDTQLEGFTGVDRLKEWEPIHSTLDHPVVRFRPIKKMGDQWLGDIQFSSSTMSYSCLYGFVCDSGSMTQVLVAEEDLDTRP